MKSDTFMYVPLLKTIQSLLQNTRIATLMQGNPNVAPAGFYFDYFDGRIYQQLETQQHSDLAIVLYFDEIDVCNPLGSKSGKNKLAMFYFAIANMESRFRSKLQAIHLPAIAKSSMVKKYGVGAILQPIIEDMQKLQGGHEFTFDNEPCVLVGNLLAYVGDTPAPNILGGFKESVGGSFSKCRECFCTTDDLKNVSECTPKRTLDDHVDKCREINRADTEYQRHNLSTFYGITRISSLLDIHNCDVCDMIPQDFMHVILEGVARYEVKEVLKKFIIEQKLFSLSQFNSVLGEQPVPYFEIDKKPSEIQLCNLNSDDNKIRQLASQMLTLIKFLPFVLSSLGVDNNVYLRFLVDLLAIVNILLSPIIASGMVVCLRHMIYTHLDNFASLFPDRPILPKQHYMTHFPQTIVKYGPPMRYSCMRFEAKHRCFKRLAPK